MRLIEEGGGKEHNQLNSCALSGSEEEDDDEVLDAFSNYSSILYLIYRI